MGLFKKLDNQIVKESKIKEVKTITIEEKKEIEKELIFGNLLESLDVDQIQAATKKEE
jgi:hypothetical protein